VRGERSKIKYILYKYNIYLFFFFQATGGQPQLLFCLKKNTWKVMGIVAELGPPRNGSTKGGGKSPRCIMIREAKNENLAIASLSREPSIWRAV